MTTITFHSADSRLDGFVVEGHSGYAEEGSDIVCAAVSAAVGLVECTVNDVLVREVELDSLEMGDVLAFANAGAYSVTEGVHLFLSRTMPRVVLRYDGGCELARDFIETSTLNTPQK